MSKLNRKSKTKTEQSSLTILSTPSCRSHLSVNIHFAKTKLDHQNVWFLLPFESKYMSIQRPVDSVPTSRPIL